jgi:hypothetical protein
LINIGIILGGHKVGLGLQKEIDDFGILRGLFNPTHVPPQVFFKPVDGDLDGNELILKIVQ